MTENRLGKGLSSLIGEDNEEPATTEENGTPAGLQELNPDAIDPNPYQPRENVAEADLDRLAKSIQKEGVLQPILVTPSKEQPDRYILAAGERRLRAAKKAGLNRIPAVVRNLDDENLLEVALVENIQRENLNPIEKARALDRLFSEFNMSLADISETTGLSESAISNTRRLLNLEPEIRDAIAENVLSPGHGRALLSLEKPSRRQKAAQKMIDRDLSVRQAETLVQNMKQGQTSSSSHTKSPLPPELSRLQERLEEQVGSRVRIKTQKNGGQIRIHYSSDRDLEAILNRLNLDLG